MSFEQKEWVAGVDDLPGASDMNRIEQGVADAHKAIGDATKEPQVITANAEDVVERVKLIPKLENGAKVADLVQSFNELHDAITGVTKEPDSE